MKRFNHGLIVGLAVLLLAAVSFIGCESPTEAEVVTGPAGPAGATGGTGGTGNPGTIYLSGSQTPQGIHAALNSAAPVVFAGVQVNGTVIIPEGKTVTLIGSPAISDDTGVLDLVVAGSVSGDGVIGQITTVNVIQKTAIPAKNLGTVTISIVAGASVAGVIPTSAISGSTVALLGPVFVKTAATANGDVAATDVGSKTVYVFGNLTVTDTASPTNVHVLGDAQITPAISGVTAISVSRDLTATLGVSAATLSVGRNLSVTGALTLAGDLAVGGTATFGNTVGLSGDTFITGLASFAGDVTVTGDKGLTLNSGFVFTANGKAIAAADSAATGIIIGSPANKVTLKKATITAETGAHLAAGTAGGVLTLPATASLGLGAAGVIAVAGSGKIVFDTTYDIHTVGVWTASAAVTLNSTGIAANVKTGLATFTGSVADSIIEIKGAVALTAVHIQLATKGGIKFTGGVLTLNGGLTGAANVGAAISTDASTANTGLASGSAVASSTNPALVVTGVSGVAAVAVSSAATNVTGGSATITATDQTALTNKTLKAGGTFSVSTSGATAVKCAV